MSTIIQSNPNCQVEIYRNTVAPSAVSNEHRKAELYSMLGLNTLAQKEKGLDPAMFYHELTAKEILVWRAFLPTAYVRNNPGHYGERDWQTYTYDNIPIEALEEIEFACKTGFFSEYIIRTPEKKVHTDPACFASTSDNRTFLIARWGESLKPFKIIKRIAWFRNNFHTLLLCFFMGLILTGGVLAIALCDKC